MMRKIAIISEHASPLAILGGVDNGGQNVYVAHIARQLASMGYEVDVFTRRDRKDLPQVMEWENGIRVIHVPAGPPEYIPKENLLKYMDSFTSFMVKFFHQQLKPYDIVHANFWMSGLVAVNLKQILGTPFVITFHALGRVRRMYQGTDDGFPDKRFEIEDRIVNEADCIIAECPQDEQDLIDHYKADPARITIVPCGFDPTELWPIDKSSARRYLNIPEGEKTILQLGRMVPRKGVDNVIQGLARLIKDHGIEARLIVVGGETDDPDPDKTPELGRLWEIAEAEGICDRVAFVGRRDRQLIKYYYSAADVFVSTPWYEPFGITPVEAMACGTPVIGANVGGIKFTVSDGETGYLVPAKDPEALAERMAYLLSNPEILDRFSKQSIRRVNELFTWQKVSRAIASIYERVINASQPVGYFEARQVEIIQNGFASSIDTLQRTQQRLSGQVQTAAQIIIECLVRGNKLLAAGNGGSAADAQHFAAEFVGRFKYPDRAALPAIALTADSAVMTAWANDMGFERIFARQVEAFGQPGDLLIGISTSGKSRNLVEAFIAAQRRGVGRIALLGGDGGGLAALSDISLIVPSNQTPRIQEVHILLLHLICELVEDQIISSPALLGSSVYAPQGSMPIQSTAPVPVTFEKTKMEE